MSAMRTVSSCAVLLCAVLSLVLCEDAVDEHALNKTQIDAMRSAMKMILKIDDDDDEVVNATSKQRSAKKLKLSKHVMELSEKIENGETIHCIEPMKDFVPHFKDILVYNLSTVGKTEKLKGAQLHIFRRRLLPQKGHSRKRLLPPPCRVRLYQLLTPQPASVQPSPTGYPLDDVVKETSDAERMKLRSLDSIPISQGTRGGWYTIDISMALKEMLNSIGATNSFIFGIRFEGPRGKSITSQHFLKEPDVNSSSSFIVVYTDESNDKQLSVDTLSSSLDRNQIDIMAELLENAAQAAIKTVNSKVQKKVPKTEPVLRYLPSKNRHSKRKMKKTEVPNNDDNIDDFELIRHGRKYYSSLIHDYRDEDEQKKSSKKHNHRFSKATPGNGDISELVDYEKVRKAKALRRHNHKTINGLNLRYDSATKSVVPKKSDFEEYEDNNEKNSTADWNRKTRSIHDNELTDYVIEFAESEADQLTTERNPYDSDDVEDEDVEGKKMSWKESAKVEKEAEREDDMGDLSYYEPDVYMHEDLIPDTYKHKSKGNRHERYDDEDPETNAIEDDDYYKYAKDVYEPDRNKYLGKKKQKSHLIYDFPYGSIKPKTTHNKDRRRHKNQKRKNRKNKDIGKQQTEKVECHLSHFDVDFEEIGWGDYVLAPAKFRAGFCSGRCSLENKNSTVKNYAVIQSLVRSINKHKGIPESCCVPAKTKPLNLIRFDASASVVLYSYKDMIVESCECR